MKPRTINSIVINTLERGFNLETSLVILDKYLIDAPKSGGPSKQTKEIKDAILKKVRGDLFGREMTCSYISAELGELDLADDYLEDPLYR